MATDLDREDATGRLPGEAELLAQARALLPPLPESEPRPGFAHRVAARAAEVRPQSLGAPWWRWAFGGGALAAAGAAALVLALAPRAPSPAPGGEPVAQLAAGPELALALRLDLLEDLPVLQEQEALEDLEVVSLLHELQPEGKP